MSGSGGGKRKLPLWRPSAREAVDREVEHHIAELTDRLEAAGMPREAAHAEARRRFGDVAAVRTRLLEEAGSRARTEQLREKLGSAVRDIGLALRGLRRRLGYAVTLVVTLGLGIGLVTALFAVVDALLLRPLPYRDTDTLLNLGLRLEGGGSIAVMPTRQIDTWRESADFMTAVEAYDVMTVVRSDGEQPEYVTALAVTPGLGDELGVRMRVGRAFTAEDGAPGAPDVAILTYAYWRRLGSPPDIVGRDLRLDGRPWAVIGVLPPEFKFPVFGRQDIWIPIQADWRASGTEIRAASVVGRRPGGLDLEQVRERSDRLEIVLDEVQPERYGWGVVFTPVTERRANPATRRSLWLLVGATAVLLALAMVNAANLTLVRSWARNHEMGIRRALGGSGRRLYRLVFLEGALLGVMAGVLAVVGAQGIVALLTAILPDEILFASVYDIAIGPRVLTFTFAVAVAAGVVLGMVAGFHALRASPLAERDITPRRLRVRKALIIAEVSLTVVLIAGAAAFGRGFVHLLRTDLGYDPDRVARVTVSLPETRYADAGSRHAFIEGVAGRLRQVPGVEAVSVGSLPPDVGFSFALSIAAEGQPPLAEQPVLFPAVDADERYLDVMGIRLVAGRGLATSDADAWDGGVRNVLIDDVLARRLWGTADPIGRRFRLDDDGPFHVVVGLVERVRFMGPDDRMAPHGMIHVRPRSLPPASASFLARVNGDAAAVLPALARAIREVDPDLPIRQLDTGSQAMGEALETPRLMATVMGTLATVAALLVGLGLFGVLAYAVSRRTREMGVRIALGASRRAVSGQLLAEGLVLGGIGVGLGLAASLYLARFASNLLYEVSPIDPLTLTGVTVFVLLTALSAALVPALRAGRTDPMAVLRED